MDKNYNKKKPRNQEAATKVAKHLSPSGYERFRDCASWIEFYADREIKKTKVSRANFCKNRFCPMCAWRQAKKDALKISTLMKYVEQEHKKAFIFVTFTAPNVKAGDLKAEITRYNKAFYKMIERKIFRKVNKGYIRKLEITYNKEPIITHEMWHGSKRHKPMAEYFKSKGLKIGDSNPNYDTYHTHFHVVFAVNPSYFSDRTYIKQETWLSEWRDVMGDPNITQVDVRRVKRGKEGKEINELAKYAAKDSDYTQSQEVFDVFYLALKGRQVTTFNGLFKDAVKLYKAGELDKYKPIDDTEYVWYLLYNWGLGEYVEKERRKLTEEERREINKALPNEAETAEKAGTNTNAYIKTAIENTTGANFGGGKSRNKPTSIAENARLMKIPLPLPIKKAIDVLNEKGGERLPDP